MPMNKKIVENAKKSGIRKNTWEIRIFLSVLEKQHFPVKVINHIVYLSSILFFFSDVLKSMGSP